MVRAAFLAGFELVMQIARALLSATHIYKAEFRREALTSLLHWRAIKRQTSRAPSNPPPDHPRGIGDFAKRNLDAIANLLDINAIDFYWVPTQTYSPNITRLAINATSMEPFFALFGSLDCQQRILCSFEGSLPGAHYYVDKLSGHKMGKMGKRPVRFFLSYPHPALDKISYSAGCEVEFFNLQGDEYHLDSVNDITSIVNSVDEIVSVAILGRNLKTWAVMRRYKSLDVCDFDIDLVYTWVDGSDDEWIRQRKQHSSIGHHDDAVDDARFLSRDELKYSLRSISYYANIFRHIFIVTNAQTPTWLNTSSNRISIVPHSEIFREPDSSLPTFNSHAIESNLHRIPGLSEHFVYLNDDMLFCDFVSKNDLFSCQGNPHIFLNNDRHFDFAAPDLTISPFQNAGRNTALTIFSEFGKVPRRKVRHAPYVNLKSVLEDIENKHYELLLRTESSRFRSHTDVSLAASLGPYWALASGIAVESALETSTIQLSERLDMSMALIRLLVFQDRQFLCINESTREEPHIQVRIDAEVKHFLERYFPVASEFEVSS